MQTRNLSEPAECELHPRLRPQPSHSQSGALGLEDPPFRLLGSWGQLDTALCCTQRAQQGSQASILQRPLQRSPGRSSRSQGALRCCWVMWRNSPCSFCSHSRALKLFPWWTACLPLLPPRCLAQLSPPSGFLSSGVLPWSLWACNLVPSSLH